ncbi:uncharacterized protein F4807DRAFT_1368 [Annulohypoxylon truncatum]|uniref:uncharacterized protein n=1 Tax=Annulohypoxylon truncatum TaxID=327061 RepID=UPI002008C6A7|nr:uncharacterized protein F4807DRAFT_1368 [Annulohypoxylon truncatum]KAI1214544.1 hypothetical protein F4807DRAFT_1368 [Annulohypoxylon truncatum]
MDGAIRYRYVPALGRGEVTCFLIFFSVLFCFCELAAPVLCLFLFFPLAVPSSSITLLCANHGNRVISGLIAAWCAPLLRSIFPSLVPPLELWGSDENDAIDATGGRCSAMRDGAKVCACFDCLRHVAR